ncbi:MAG: hypothetical protein REI09_08645 [Candidatus Dactylopiibacterium sp.]|nr:hypothetical protein [Candidatus Dactylopiibacterium sp.]
MITRSASPSRWSGACSLALLLAACGGGGGGSETATTPMALPGETSLQADCSASDASCATRGTAYSGQGVGTWLARNDSRFTATLPVTLSGVAGKRITLVYTNPTASEIPLPGITLSKNASANLTATTATPSTENQIPARIRDFQPPAFRPAGAQRSILAATTGTPHVEGDQRNWYIAATDDTIQTRAATLKKQAALSSGRHVNFWVEDSEYGGGKITDTLLTTLAGRFATDASNVYDMVTGVAGAPWGPHAYPDILAAEQDIDIVLVNFDRNQKAYGMLGYFWSLNNFRRDASNADLKYSNESLSFYLDTETFYLEPTEGVDVQTSTLSHEFVHMINFYQRMVAPAQPNPYGTAWEEMSAMMMEDVVGLRLTPASHSIRDTRFPQWLQQRGYNCNLLAWIDTNTSCFSYSVAGSFGGYLLRQYGIERFYKHFLRNMSVTATTAPIELLDGSIRAAGGPGFAEAFRRWTTSVALLPAPGSPAGFGYPERIESGFTLPALNGPTYAGTRRLPTSVPATLQPYASFPFERQSTTDVYSETLQIPPGATLSIIVQNN